MWHKQSIEISGNYKCTYNNDNVRKNISSKNCKICTNYIDFMDAVQSLRLKIAKRLKNDKNYMFHYFYIIDIANNELILISHNESRKFSKVEIVYKFETKEIASLFHTFIKFNCIGTVVNTASSLNCKASYYKFNTAMHDNNIEIILNYYIMKLLLCVTVIKSRGEKLYFTYEKKKKSGGYRTIVVPHEEYKAVLRELDEMLQLKLGHINNKFQVAYKKGKSIFDNALPHMNNKYTCCIDLHDFYGSCRKKLVYDALSFMCNTKIPNDASYSLFIDTLLRDNALFMGNPCSGTIANYIISKAVAKMYVICKNIGISLTVYADDITFSSDRPLSKQFCIDIWNTAFTDCGLHDYFTLSLNKCHCASNNMRDITGVKINHLNQITINRHMYNDIKVSLHQMSYDKNTKLSKSRLRGNLAYMYAIDRSGKFVKLLNTYKDTIIKNNIFSEETFNKLLTSNNLKIEEVNALCE